MKSTKLWVLIIGLLGALCVVTAVGAQLAAVAATKSPFAGTWEGEMNGLPAVTLIVADADGGTVGGVITFYFQKKEADGKWRVEGRFAAPLLAAHFKGKVLAFEVQHHKNHDSPEFGSNVKFHLELSNTNTATLENLEEDSAGPITLTRRN